MGSLTVETIHDQPWVGMATAPNPGPKTLSGTHTYLVGRSRTYIIDPGPADAGYQQALATWLRAHGRRVAGILLTHGHPDHAPGAALLKERVSAPVWASSRMPASQRHAASVDRLYAENQQLDLEECTLRILAAPGHSVDSVVIWLDTAGIIFAGDTILGEGTTLIAPPEGNMARYMETLEMLRRTHVRLIAPGHGPLVTDPAAKIGAYISHRLQRERQILGVLQSGPASVNQLVDRIYTDVDPALHTLAAGSVEAQLAKLVDEGRVRRSGEEFSLNRESATR
jgi:hydroxyacylglutathione hydrolase